MIVEPAINFGGTCGGSKVGVRVAGGAGSEGLEERPIGGVFGAAGRRGEHVFEPVVVVRLAAEGCEFVEGCVDLGVSAAAGQPIAGGEGEKLLEETGRFVI